MSASNDSYIMGVASKLTSDLQSSMLARSQCLERAEESVSECVSEARSRVEARAQTNKATTIRHTSAAKELWRKVLIICDRI